MKDLEINKIVASVLTGTLIALACGKAAHVLYRPEASPEIRGYQVAVSDAAAAVVEDKIPFPALLAQADLKAGSKIFRKCVSCHNVEQGAPNKIGPNLYGVVGADKGHVSDFAYSAALKAKGGTWDIDSLQAFLKKPTDYINGTKMSFNGLKKDDDIANVIAYLRQQGSPDYPLPAIPVTEVEPSEDAAAGGDPVVENDITAPTLESTEKNSVIHGNKEGMDPSKHTVTDDINSVESTTTPKEK